MSWHLGMLCALDFESTGLSVDSDRIVTACAADYLGRQSKAAKTVEEQDALYERSEAVRAEAVVGHWPVIPLPAEVAR